MSRESFERFRILVMEDPDLQEALRNVSDYESFIELLIQLADQKGYSVTAEDIESASIQSKQAWFERHLYR